MWRSTNCSSWLKSTKEIPYENFNELIISKICTWYMLPILNLVLEILISCYFITTELASLHVHAHNKYCSKYQVKWLESTTADNYTDKALSQYPSLISVAGSGTKLLLKVSNMKNCSLGNKYTSNNNTESKFQVWNFSSLFSPPPFPSELWSK